VPAFAWQERRKNTEMAMNLECRGQCREMFDASVEVTSRSPTRASRSAQRAEDRHSEVNSR
jgi:hypothetical protein